MGLFRKNDIQKKFDKIRFYVEQGLFEEAVNLLNDMLSVDPKDDRVWFMKGSVLGLSGHSKEAIESYDKGLEINPNIGIDSIWMDRGTQLAALGRYEEAITSYDYAIALNANYENAYYNKGNAFRKLKRFDEAINTYNQGLKVNPFNEKILYNKGFAYFESERYLLAIDCFDQLIMINKNHDDAWYRKGICLQKLERYGEAISCYDQVLRINPRDDSALRQKGICLADSGMDLEGAISCFNEALSIDSSDYGVWTLIGLTYEKLGRFDDATDAYKKFLEHEPSNEFINFRLSCCLGSQIHNFVMDNCTVEFKGVGFKFKGPNTCRMIEYNYKVASGFTVPEYRIYDENDTNLLNITYFLSKLWPKANNNDVYSFLIANGYVDIRECKLGNLEGFAATDGKGSKEGQKIIVLFFKDSDYSYVIDYTDEKFLDWISETIVFTKEHVPITESKPNENMYYTSDSNMLSCELFSLVAPSQWELKKEFENEQMIIYSVYNEPLDSIRINIKSMRYINSDLLEAHQRDELYNHILSQNGSTKNRQYNLPNSGTGRSYFANGQHFIIILKCFYAHIIEYSDVESLAVLNTINFKDDC